MSYTMTIDVPEKVTSYVERRGPRFKALLGSMFIAFVMTEMRQDEARTESVGGDFSQGTGLDLFNRLRMKSPLLDDDELRIFDRVKDYGRKVELV